MTVTIPRWALVAAAVLAVAVVAFLIGRGSGDDSDGGGAGGNEAAALACNEDEMNMVLAAGEFTDAVNELGVTSPGEELLAVWEAKLIDCVNLNDDEAEEMIVQLACCTAASPAPWAIFEQVEGEWTPSVIRTRVPSGFVEIGEDGAITEKHGTFADGDPLCCPTGERQGTVSWNGTRFVYQPETGGASREIALAGDTPESLAGLPVQTANLQTASELFGVPSSVLNSGDVCTTTWADLGLVIDFVNLGGADACGPEGAVGGAKIGGYEAELAGWETNEGATVGITEEELADLYPEITPGPADTPDPDAKFPGRTFHLVQRPSPIGDSGFVPSVAATLHIGKVTSYELYVGAGGE